MSGSNPLSKFTRRIRSYIDLPSKGLYYGNDTFEEDAVNSEGEVGLRAMTALDEAELKSPDGLLNGQSLERLLLSCVAGLKDPKLLYMNDVDRILIGIKSISNKDGKIESEVSCPACEKYNNYEIDLDTVLQVKHTIEDLYVVNLPSGLTVYMRPMTYGETMNNRKATFEYTRMMRVMKDDSLDEDQKITEFSKTFKKVTELNFNMIASVITQIVKEDEDINVTNQEHIKEFLFNIDYDDGELLKEEFNKISNIGRGHERKLVCHNDECKHEWEATINFNPVDFFMEF